MHQAPGRNASEPLWGPQPARVRGSRPINPIVPEVRHATHRATWWRPQGPVSAGRAGARPGRKPCATRRSTSTSASSATSAAPERRLLAARGLSRRGATTSRSCAHAPCRRHALADAGDPRHRPSELAASLEAGAAHRAARPGRLRDRRAWRSTTVWQPDKQQEAESVFGTTDDSHPGVDHLLNQHPALLRRRPPGRHRQADRLRLQAAARRPPGPPREFGAGAGRGSSPSRPGTRCTGRIRS